VQKPDFSVVLFRPNFMLASEEHPMKAHKNQWLLTLPSPPDLPCGVMNQGTHHRVWGADAFKVAMPDETPKRDVLITYCAQSTFMRYHQKISTHPC
jgi:hypothetical protein